MCCYICFGTLLQRQTKTEVNESWDGRALQGHLHKAELWGDCTEFSSPHLSLYSQMNHFAPLNFSVFKYQDTSRSQALISPSAMTAYPCDHGTRETIQCLQNLLACIQAPHYAGVASTFISLSSLSVFFFFFCYLPYLVYPISTDLLGLIQRLLHKNLLLPLLADIFSTPSSELLQFLLFSSWCPS